MNLAKALIIITLSVFVKATAQNLEKTNVNCQILLVQANDHFTLKEYQKASSFFLKALNTCENFDKSSYDKLVTSLKNSQSQQSDISVKQAYIDTIIYIFQFGEQNGFYDQFNDLTFASYLLKLKNPNYKEADRLFTRGLDKSAYYSGENFLNLYYFNLYNLYKQADSTEKSNFKQRLLLEFLRLSNWISEGNLSDQLKSNVSLYFNDVFKKCEDFEQAIISYLLTEETKTKLFKQNLEELKKILEAKQCSDTKIYERIIDSLIVDEATTELYLIKARIFQNQKDYSKEFSTLFFARKFSDDKDQQSEIDFLSARSLFNAGNYHEAYKLALAISGLWKSEGYILAAKCVASMVGKCGATDIENKLNWYHALDLLVLSKKNDTFTMDLIKKYKSELPTQEELNAAGIKKGEFISLPCWNLLIQIS